MPYVQTVDRGGGGGQGGRGGQRNYGSVDQEGRDSPGSGDNGGNEGGDRSNVDNTKLTIGEALEATARAIGNEPVQPSDAAAISAAETTACGADVSITGGIGDAAVAAASANVSATRDEEKIKIRDILSVCYFCHSSLGTILKKIYMKMQTK